MLVIDRKVGESFWLDFGSERVRVDVVGLSHSKVRIGIKASRSVRVARCPEFIDFDGAVTPLGKLKIPVETDDGDTHPQPPSPD